MIYYKVVNDCEYFFCLFCQCIHNTDCIVFASGVLYLTFCDINVLHADLLAIVGSGCARKGQQEHVDGTNIGLTSTGGDSKLVMVPNLVTVEDGERQGALSFERGRLVSLILDSQRLKIQIHPSLLS